MNSVEEWMVKKEVQMGIDKFLSSIDGYKSYILAAIGILVSLVGHVWGPITIAGAQIPQQSWSDVWKVVYASGVISALRHGISKNTPTKGA